MELLQLAGVTIIVCSAIFALALVDKKYQLNLNMDVNGLPMADDVIFGNKDTHQQVKKQLVEKDKTIAALAERIAVLEKIVTDPTEQLKQDIEQLK